MSRIYSSVSALHVIPQSWPRSQSRPARQALRRAFCIACQPHFSAHRTTNLSLDDIIATWYYTSVIESFASAETKKIFLGQISARLPRDIQRTARRKLLYLNDAEDLQDLLAPPGNQLEKLKGDRSGQYSIRINDQWRICFEWSDGKAKKVEIVDYHG